MNKTLLLILCDFLLLNLLALTRWEKAEPVRAKAPPVPELAANAATRDRDLVAAMQQSLADEQATRDQLTQKLNSTQSSLVDREKNLSQLQTERTQLTSTLNQTQQQAADIAKKFAAATQEATMTKEQLEALHKELADRQAESERQKKSLATLEQQQAEARQRIEGLTVAMKVAESEKNLLRENAETFRQQAVAERQEREKVQATTVELAQGVGQLAEKSGQLTKEIRDNRPINANVLFNDFLANRVQTTFSAERPGLFGKSTKTREPKTVFASDGKQVYALVHLADTMFSVLEPGVDWDKLTVEFSRSPDYHSAGSKIEFLSIDPRVIALPVDPSQVTALGVKVYQIALDPFKFPDAVLVSGGGKGYGEVGFKLDASQPGYVRVDNRFFKRIFGEFAPSRGDLVLSKTGELLGIMVNSDYCALVTNFLPSKTIATGEDVKDQHIGATIDDLAARYRALPFKLQ